MSSLHSEVMAGVSRLRQSRDLTKRMPPLRTQHLELHLGEGCQITSDLEFKHLG